MRQNVRFTNNTAFPIYETKAVFYSWLPAGTGLNANSGGYGALPITITSTQLAPNTQTFAAFPYGYINMGDAASAGTSTTRLWIFDIPGGVLTTSQFLLMEYRWRTQASGVTVNLNDVSFIDGNNGYIVGNGGTILRTSDAGSLWSSQVSGTTRNLLGCSVGADSSHAWAVGVNGIVAEGNIRVTTDGGASWAKSTSGTTRTLRSVSFVNNSVGWTVGNNGTIRRTSDGGTNWNAQVGCDATTPTYRGVFALDANTAWIVGDNGTVCRTVNAGVNWLGPGGLSDGYVGSLQNTYFVNATTGWVTGNGGRIYKSTNGGATWTLQPSGTASNLGGNTFIDLNNGWSVGTAAQVLHTTDGGATWTLQEDGLGGAPTYNAITVKNDANGNPQLWMVGNGGRLRTYK